MAVVLRDERVAEMLEKYEELAASSQYQLIPTSSSQNQNGDYQNENIEISFNIYTICGGIRGGLGSKIVQFLGTLLAPSFLKQNPNPKSKLHPTSWLDGLRGVAAFFVFIHHFILVWFPALSYGYESFADKHYFFQLPILRIIYAGRGMVTIFFVISGYVLSYSALRKIRNREFAQLLDTLASSVFRRYLRLFLPILASTFITMVFLRFGWWNGAQGALILPTRLPTLKAQLWDWWQQFILLSNPFMGIEGGSVYADPYGPQLWTIPREFRGSLIIYLTLLGLAKTGQIIRVVLMLALSLFSLWIQQWDVYLFISGMLLCEVQFIRQDFNKNGSSFHFSKYIPRYVQQCKNTIFHIITLSATVLAIHFLTFPDEGADTTPGYGHMIAFTPIQYGGKNLTQRYWLCLGAVLLG